MSRWRARAVVIAGVMGLVAAAAAGASCGGGAPTVAFANGKRTVASNVRRQDYVGSQACARCHRATYDAFMKAPMHRMTRKASVGEIVAPFDGARFELGGDSVVAFEEDGRKYMRLVPQTGVESLYRITKVIGGRTREDYVGVHVRDTGGGDDVIVEKKGERVMPLSYLLFSKSWRYKGYSVMVRERDKLHVGASWSETCIFCHNTEPLLDALYDDVKPTKNLYQGSVGENLLPRGREWRYTIADESAFVASLGQELAALDAKAVNGDLDHVLDAAIDSTRKRFTESSLIELGVGCESCHLGSRAHADDPTILPTLEAVGAGLAYGPADPKAKTHAAVVNRTCARCHTVLFSQYPYTWEGGLRSDGEPGGSHINSGEARDFLLGGCTAELDCVSCHDPHTGSSRARLDELGSIAGNSVCTKCHEKMASDGGLRQHTRHASKSEGSACLNCHMPKKNVGLSYELTRYHRIGSPTNDARVYGDRPLECALCHTDWSVEKTIGEMEKGWDKHFDRDRMKALYGDLGRNVLEATVELGKPHEQVAAATAFVDRGELTKITNVLPVFASPYPLIRLFVAHAIERRTGKRLDIDLEADSAEIQKAVRARLSESK